MKNSLLTVLIVLLCVLPDALFAQGWTRSTYEAEPNGQATYHAPAEDNLSWMTLNRGATTNRDATTYSAEPQFTSGQSGRYNDPFLDQTSNQQSVRPTLDEGYQPTYEPELQDAGYSTLDLLPNELPPELPSPTGRPPRGSTLSVALDARWEPSDNGFGVTEVWGGFKTAAGPPLFGGTPPMVSFNFGMTDLKGVELVRAKRAVTRQSGWHRSLDYRCAAGTRGQYFVAQTVPDVRQKSPRMTRIRHRNFKTGWWQSLRETDAPALENYPHNSLTGWPLCCTRN
ncbi:hypothetical protein OAE80_00940 [Planctomycetaceae bacterium]|nr:hypothetical protein [Planctomycetaceae bacterium]